MKVFLREKKMTKGRRSLYLDFYPPILHPETRKPTRREHLKLFIYENLKPSWKEITIKKRNFSAKRSVRSGSLRFKADTTVF